MGKGTVKRFDPGTGGWTGDLLGQEVDGVTRLGFTPSLERQFRSFLSGETVGQARAALVIAVVVFLLFGLLDRLLFPELAGGMWFLRYAVVGPFLLLLLAASFTSAGERLFFWAVLGTMLGVAGGIVGFMAITSSADANLYFGGLMLTTIVAYVFFGLRLSQAALGGWGVLAVYAAGDPLFIGSDRIHYLNNVLGLVATNILGMVAAYLLERQHRKVFLQSLLLEREKQQLERANARLKELSYEDGLTGIANRRFFDEQLAEEWARALRHAYPLTLLMLDLDHFKAFNDSRGHQAGDECLRAVGTVLRGFTKRPGDLAARYGGEEFVVLLTGTSGGDGWEIAEMIRREIAGLGLEHLDSPVAEVVTVSIGLASTVPAPGMTPEELIAAADRALYAAKESGRNRVFME